MIRPRTLPAAPPWAVLPELPQIRLWPLRQTTGKSGIRKPVPLPEKSKNDTSHPTDNICTFSFLRADMAKSPLLMLFSTGTLQLLLCLAVSNIRTEAAIAAFRDSTFPSMGIFTRQSASEVVSSVRPLASFPIKSPHCQYNLPGHNYSYLADGPQKTHSPVFHEQAGILQVICIHEGHPEYGSHRGSYHFWIIYICRIMIHNNAGDTSAPLLPWIMVPRFPGSCIVSSTMMARALPSGAGFTMSSMV